MKCIIPEISWHNRDPVLGIDVQIKKENESFYRLASCGTDSHVLIWQLITKESGEVQLDCVCDLTRHQKTVNTVKFSPSGEFLASGDDDSFIIIWKQRTEEDVLDCDSEEGGENIEQWTQVKILRGHLNDVLDLAWSPDSVHLLSGSVDNSAIIWDVRKGKKVAIFPEGNNFVQGVTWDPENKYIATLSSDSKYRLYCWSTQRLIFSVNRHHIPRRTSGEEDKPTRLFHDDSLKTFFRRLEFSPDGMLLAVPTGIVEPLSDSTDKPLYVTWLFSRKQFNVPVLYYPSDSQPSMVVRWCPIKFQLRPDIKPVLLLPYRMILAVATKSMIILYDTQYAVPIGLISNIHYTKLTDMTWSSDGRILIASSTDGYCSIVTFAQNELGEKYCEKTQGQKHNS